MIANGVEGWEKKTGIRWMLSGCNNPILRNPIPSAVESRDRPQSPNWIVDLSREKKSRQDRFWARHGVRKCRVFKRNVDQVDLRRKKTISEFHTHTQKLNLDHINSSANSMSYKDFVMQRK
ncbi:hypothetical protein NPIL_156721 [Nephila pilipes]|uniref:Uncharacterized protein n=1 Tax=Nephila pilipes TaxID=299642 RepID=A0A8X6TLJ3_NEPPI|nr:hypothetical protein NPIL_156721 [Nephila pilipes]